MAGSTVRLKYGRRQRLFKILQAWLIALFPYGNFHSTCMREMPRYAQLLCYL